MRVPPARFASQVITAATPVAVLVTLLQFDDLLRGIDALSPPRTQEPSIAVLLVILAGVAFVLFAWLLPLARGRRAARPVAALLSAPFVLWQSLMWAVAADLGDWKLYSLQAGVSLWFLARLALPVSSSLGAASPGRPW